MREMRRRIEIYNRNVSEISDLPIESWEGKSKEKKHAIRGFFTPEKVLEFYRQGECENFYTREKKVRDFHTIKSESFPYRESVRGFNTDKECEGFPH